MHSDPLDSPVRREQSKRKTKGVVMNSIESNEQTDFGEPDEYADSDTDPVWKPQDEQV